MPYGSTFGVDRFPSLNNADDVEILKRQEAHVDPDLFRKVSDFHRRVASLRYKETAYDSLFRGKDRGGYWKWLWRSVMETGTLPTAISLAYLALTAAPAGLIDRVDRVKKRSSEAGSLGQSTTHHQKVCEEFVWMGVRRGDIQLSRSDSGKNWDS